MPIKQLYNVSFIFLGLLLSFAITAHAGGPIIWSEGEVNFNQTTTGQSDCIVPSTCLTRSTVLYNSVVESPSGQQPCPGYIGPANTEWAFGDISDWATLEYQPLFDTINCRPIDMVGLPMVLHLIDEDIYLQVTFNSWRQGGIRFDYTRTSEPGSLPLDTKFDFDGDSKTDPSVFRPDSGEWWILRSSDLENRAFQFGESTDQPVPADFTGDGVTDIAFWRPSNGEWFVLKSEDSTFFSFPFGSPGDVPVTGDFDGDGKADPAIYRETAGTWFVQSSNGSGTTFTQFGASGDKPTVADFDGDGRDDIAVFKPELAQWWQLRSNAGLIAYQFGQAGDMSVVGDYTGDGVDDVAFWRPSTAEWFILRSEGDGFYSFPYGLPSDLPVPGDYDGDGTMDYAVFRSTSNTWFILGSANGFSQLNFGGTGDVPLPNTVVRSN